MGSFQVAIHLYISVSYDQLGIREYRTGKTAPSNIQGKNRAGDPHHCRSWQQILLTRIVKDGLHAAQSFEICSCNLFSWPNFKFPAQRVLKV